MYDVIISKKTPNIEICPATVARALDRADINEAHIYCSNIEYGLEYCVKIRYQYAEVDNDYAAMAFSATYQFFLTRHVRISISPDRIAIYIPKVLIPRSWVDFIESGTSFVPMGMRIFALLSLPQLVAVSNEIVDMANSVLYNEKTALIPEYFNEWNEQLQSNDYDFSLLLGGAKITEKDISEFNIALEHAFLIKKPFKFHILIESYVNWEDWK